MTTIIQRGLMNLQTNMTIQRGLMSLQRSFSIHHNTHNHVIKHGVTIVLFHPLDGTSKQTSITTPSTTTTTPLVLLVQRSKAPMKYHWAFPGGSVESLESFLEAAEREMYEECNIHIKIRKFIQTTDVLPSNDSAIHFQLHHYLAEDITSEQAKLLRHGDDALGLAWISLSTVLESYQRRRKNTEPGIKPGEFSPNISTNSDSIPILDSSSLLVPGIDAIFKAALDVRG